MGPIVAVDLPNAPAELRGRALGGCNAALRAGRCVLLGEAPEADYVAIIRAGTEPRGSVVVTFRRREAPAESAEVRYLSFESRDDAATRWAAAGLVVASLVSAERQTQRGPAPEPSEPSRPATPASTATPVSPAAAPAAARLVAPAISGLGSVSVAPHARARGGLELVLTSHLVGLPLFGAAAARYAIAPGTADLRSVDLALGVGMRLGGWSARWSSELRTDLVWEQLTALATPSGSGEGQATQSRWGARASACLVLAASKQWAGLAGAELTLLKPDVRVVLDGKEAAFDPSLRYGFLIGVRFSP